MMILLVITVNAQPASDQQLSTTTQAIVRITALTGKGDLDKLKTELNRVASAAYNP